MHCIYVAYNAFYSCFVLQMTLRPTPWGIQSNSYEFHNNVLRGNKSCSSNKRLEETMWNMTINMWRVLNVRSVLNNCSVLSGWHMASTLQTSNINHCSLGYLKQNFVSLKCGHTFGLILVVIKVDVISTWLISRDKNVSVKRSTRTRNMHS